jgi:hypothetical protein
LHCANWRQESAENGTTADALNALQSTAFCSASMIRVFKPNDINRALFCDAIERQKVARAMPVPWRQTSEIFNEIPEMNGVTVENDVRRVGNIQRS